VSDSVAAEFKDVTTFIQSRATGHDVNSLSYAMRSVGILLSYLLYRFQSVSKQNERVYSLCPQVSIRNLPKPRFSCSNISLTCNNSYEMPEIATYCSLLGYLWRVQIVLKHFVLLWCFASNFVVNQINQLL